MHRLHPAAMYDSVRHYLHELEESGVDGLPAEEQGHGLVEACTLDELQKQIGDCQRCPLAQSRTTLVFGGGNEKARLVFVGEAPGAAEDRQGQPFVGEAGQVLTRLIEAMGLKRDQVYLCSVLKCRLPDNRNPHKDEIATCAPFLMQQLRLIKPEMIVALGTFAAQTLLESKEPISRLRGQFHSCHGIPVMPTFHPSFLLHHKDNKQHYWDVWSDMEQVLHKLKLPVPEKKQGRGQKKD